MENQHVKSDGTRTRTGCLTCRIRKKKCDELRPTCRTCLSRRLACYGFSDPVPAWISSKRSWPEIRSSEEARTLRRVAELQYRASRKVEAHIDASTVATLLDTQGHVDQTPQSSSSGELVQAFEKQKLRLQSVPYLAAGVNIWQTRPESIWWDSKLQNLRPSPSSSSKDDSGQHHSASPFYAFNYSSPSSREGTRLLLIFLDVIHPITHTFYRLQTSMYRSWMMSRLVETESLFCSAISISACFEHSLTQPPSLDGIGLCARVLRLQSESIAKLRTDVVQFALMSPDPVEDFLSAGVRLLGVIAHLQTLEIFSMLSGQWEMHHHASKRVLNHIELCSRQGAKSPASVITTMLSEDSPICDSQRRSLEFSLLNYVWIDVLATSTFQSSHTYRCTFDHLPLLDSGMLKPQNITGCQGWVWASICRIVRLGEWKEAHRDRLDNDHVQIELWQRCHRIDQELDININKLPTSGTCLHEQPDTPMRQDGSGSKQRRSAHREHPTKPHTNDVGCYECDMNSITCIWAYGAKILLQVLIISAFRKQVSVDQTSVNLCLERLELLPIRLVLRITWPYTIAGSMATSESQQQRFRWIVGKTLQGAQAPGVSWKGLLVMEECWRLRRTQGEEFITWREAMENLNAKILLA